MKVYLESLGTPAEGFVKREPVPEGTMWIVFVSPKGHEIRVQVGSEEAHRVYLNVSGPSTPRLLFCPESSNAAYAEAVSSR